MLGMIPIVIGSYTSIKTEMAYFIKPGWQSQQEAAITSHLSSPETQSRLLTWACWAAHLEREGKLPLVITAPALRGGMCQ